MKKQTQLAIWIMLSTACRVGELLMAEWSHINIDQRVWFIPKENVRGLRKKKRAQVIFLSDFTMRQFEELKKRYRGSKWCFPATQHGGYVALDVVTDQVADRQLMFKERKPLTGRTNDNSLVLNGGASGDWTPHDLRRTAATSMQVLKVSLDVIDRCQNHVIKGSRARRHYMHHEYADEMRDAWKLLGEYLDKIISSELISDLDEGRES